MIQGDDFIFDDDIGSACIYEIKSFEDENFKLKYDAVELLSMAVSSYPFVSTPLSNQRIRLAFST